MKMLFLIFFINFCVIAMEQPRMSPRTVGMIIASRQLIQKTSSGSPLNAVAAIALNDEYSLLSFINSGIEINEKDQFGDTLLHYAVYFGRLSMAEILCKRGADPRIRGTGGCCAKSLLGLGGFANSTSQSDVINLPKALTSSPEEDLYNKILLGYVDPARKTDAGRLVTLLEETEKKKLKKI